LERIRHCNASGIATHPASANPLDTADILGLAVRIKLPSQPQTEKIRLQKLFAKLVGLG
jgi:hypothetical protein